MKLYTCSNCHSLIYFENNVCLHCGYSLGFDANTTFPDHTGFGKGTDVFSNIQNKQQKFRYCKNAEYGTCNWIIPASAGSNYCGL